MYYGLFIVTAITYALINGSFPEVARDNSDLFLRFCITQKQSATLSGKNGILSANPVAGACG